MGRSYVLDLVTQHFDTPRVRRLVQFANDMSVDIRPLLKGPILFYLSELAAERGLGKL